MKLWHHFLLLTCIIFSRASAAEASFDVDPTEVAAGQAIMLGWDVPPGSRAFLSSVGVLVGPNLGSLRVTPAFSSDFILVVESGKLTPQVIIRHVTVKGKGSDNDVPDTTRALPFKNEYNFGNLKLVDLSDLAARVLQADHFAVTFSGQRDGRVVIVTGWSDSFIPVDPKDGLRRFHRLKYRVTFSAMGRTTFAEISAEINWRVPKHPSWFPEDEAGPLYPRMIAELKQKLCNDCKGMR